MRRARIAKNWDGTQDKTGQSRKGRSKTEKGCSKTEKDVLKQEKMFQKSDFPVLEHPFLLCPVLSRVPSRILAVPARPVPWQDFELVPLSFCPGTKNFSCPGVPLSRDKGRSKYPGTISVSEHHFPVLEVSFSALSRFVLGPVPDFGCPVPSRPEFQLSRPVLSLGKISSLSPCIFVPGQ